MSTISKLKEDSSIKIPEYILGKSGLKLGTAKIIILDVLLYI